jgi:hypothetical protein
MSEKSRGSANLGALSPEALHKAIGQARESYTIKRWWKYGQPAIDRVKAVLDVKEVASAGAVVGNLIKMHNQKSQVGVLVFPYGVPVIDGVRIELEIDQAR